MEYPIIMLAKNIYVLYIMAKTARKSICKRVKNPKKCKKLKGCKLAKGTKRTFCRTKKNKTRKSQ